MSFHLITRWGASESEPTVARMREALRELDAHGLGHPDTWLNHESGWSLSAFSNGLLVWENLDTDDIARHMNGVTRERVLELWIKLAQGRLVEIETEPWLPGYQDPK